MVASTLEQRLTEFPGKFRIVFKYFPMNKTCNDYINNTLHAASCAAAVTAEAARLLGGQEAFWKMHDELFRDPDGFAKKARNTSGRPARRSAWTTTPCGRRSTRTPRGTGSA